MVYSPLMSLRRKEYKEYLQYLDTLGKKYNRTAAQIIIRFDVQRGLVPIPKSSHDERLKNNISVFDFSLSEQEMETLYSFNVDLQYLPESKSCPGL
jgi:diketogulonate reductase-like aldo/keto reductase